ncbi:unnamed protein product, partial [marine sediment metagenome]
GTGYTGWTGWVESILFILYIPVASPFRAVSLSIANLQAARRESSA